MYFAYIHQHVKSPNWGWPDSPIPCGDGYGDGRGHLEFIIFVHKIAFEVLLKNYFVFLPLWLKRHQRMAEGSLPSGNCNAD